MKTDLVSTGAAAQHLGVSTSTVRRLIDTGELDAENVGGRWLFRLADLDAYLADQDEAVDDDDDSDDSDDEDEDDLDGEDGLDDEGEDEGDDEEADDEEADDEDGE